MAKKGYDLLTTKQQAQFDAIINEAKTFQSEGKLMFKDLQRESKKGILIAKQGKYSDFKQSFLIRGSQYTIPNTFKKYGTRVASDFYQDMIDKALAKNEEILNKEYLKGFGLRVTKELVT